MPRYEITAPDGRRFEITAPDGATQDQVLAYAQQQFGAAPEQPKRGVREIARDVAAGAVRGAGSIGATLLRPFESAEANQQRRADIDSALQDLTGADPQSTAYAIGKGGAEIVGTLGAGGALARPLASVAPRLSAALASGGLRAGGATGLQGAAIRAAGGAAAGGAAAGLANPDEAATGAAIGAALPGAVQAAGVAGRAVGRAVSPNVNNPELARKAIQEYGIPLGPANISDSRMTKALRSVLNDAPMTGGIGSRQGEAVQEGFNRAVGRTFGADAPKLTDEVMQEARKRMGGEFDRLWGRNVVPYDGELFQSVQMLRSEVDKLPQGEAARLSKWLDDIESKMVTNEAGEMFMPGDVANRMQSAIRKQAESAQGFTKEALTNLRQSILGAFNRNVSPEDAAALAGNMKQYRALKTVEPLLVKGEAGVAGQTVGDVPAALLSQRVAQQYGTNIARSPFADLAQIGSQYVADRVPQTGGSARALLQNSAIGGALGAGMFTEPLTASAVIPVAMGAQKLLGSPTLGRMSASAQPLSSLARLPGSMTLAELLAKGAPVGVPAITAD